jgi:PhnB protein
MQINPYLFYNGNCEAAFTFYEKVLGGRIEMLLRNEDAPESMPSPPERKMKIMHARISIDGAVLMASDAPPDRFNKPQGFAVSLTIGGRAQVWGIVGRRQRQHAVRQNLLLQRIRHVRRSVRDSLDG